MSGEGDAARDSAWRPPAPSRPEAAEELPGYDDLREVGRGGDSIVYRARQVALGRDVAVKVLLVDDEPRRARFTREIEITVALGRQHPNIVNVLDVGTTASGRPALVMDFYDGGTLHDRLRAHGPLPVEEVVRIGVVLADALAFAHGRGVLHRDVKPQNVLVLPTSWVLADFGIARLTDSEHTSSAETFTYRHAAPQILDGHPPTAGDDIWSLGSTLFTLADGRPPFSSDDPHDDTALAYLRRARTEPPRRLEGTGAAGLAGVVDRCLAKDVDERWASAAELRDALADLRSRAWEPTGQALTSPPRPSGPRPVEAPAVAAVAPSPVAPSPVAESPLAEPPVAAPVALSALAHDAGPEPADAAPTGAMDRTGGSPEPASYDDVPATDDAAPPRRPRVLWMLTATAIVVGLALGVGGSLLSPGEDDATTTDVTPSPDSSVTSLTAPPTQTGDPQPEGRPVAELSPIITELEVSFSGAELEWTDPSDGEGIFTVERIEDQATSGLDEFPRGTTAAPLAFANSPGNRVCFRVLLFVDDDYGVSETRCATA